MGTKNIVTEVNAQSLFVAAERKDILKTTAFEDARKMVVAELERKPPQRRSLTPGTVSYVQSCTPLYALVQRYEVLNNLVQFCRNV